MALVSSNIRFRTLSLAPIIFLYFLSITEMDTEFSNLFEILSFNLQFIVVYYWMLKAPAILGNTHIFVAGIMNDIIMSLTLGTSAITYLIVSLVASYIRNVTVNTSLFSDWFTFLFAILISNSVYVLLISNFSNFEINYLDLFYNIFFTFLFFPIFWKVFNFYSVIINIKKDD